MFTQYKSWRPYISPFDPCKPIEVKYYATPHNYIWVFNHLDYHNFQPQEKR